MLNLGPGRFSGRKLCPGTTLRTAYTALTARCVGYKPVSARARTPAPRFGPLSDPPARDHDQYQPAERATVDASSGLTSPRVRPTWRRPAAHPPGPAIWCAPPRENSLTRSRSLGFGPSMVRDTSRQRFRPVAVVLRRARGHLG